MQTDRPAVDHENDMTAFERRLAAWRPSGSPLARDRMLFNAGRATALDESRIRYWRLTTVALILVTSGLGVLLAQERSQRLALQTASAFRSRSAETAPIVSSSAPAPAFEPLAPISYFALTTHLMANDLETPALPANNDARPVNPDPAHPRAPLGRRPLRSRDFNSVLDL
jgi:hypothetical protein